MRRVLLHILFWIVYLVQDSLLQYAWAAPALPAVSERQQLLMAFEAGAAVLLPKLLFTYCVLYLFLDRLLKESRHLLRNTCFILLLFCITVVLYRAVLQYYVYDYIYAHVFKPRPLLSLSQVLLAAMDIGCVSGIVVTLKLLRIQLRAKEREKNLLKEKLETELKFLRNQTNPHFLFNTLNNIYALARKKSADTAAVVLKLSELLRFMLYESAVDRIPLATEIRVLNDYLELEKIRYNERLSVAFEQQIGNEQAAIAPLLLLPFVENAFKHGISESRFNSFVRIYLAESQGLLTFHIENSTENGSPAAITDKIGLSNVRRQLQLMYPEHNLTIQNGQSLFAVHLTINLNSYAKI